MFRFTGTDPIWSVPPPVSGFSTDGVPTLPHRRTFTAATTAYLWRARPLADRRLLVAKLSRPSDRCCVSSLAATALDVIHPMGHGSRGSRRGRMRHATSEAQSGALERRVAMA